MTNVTLDQLIKAIEAWNYMKAGKKTDGTFSVSVSDIIEGASLFGDPSVEWHMVSSGPLTGSRYTKTQHGYVVQAPMPSNEISLVQEGTARLIGLV